MKKRNKIISLLILVAISCEYVNYFSTIKAKAAEDKNTVNVEAKESKESEENKTVIRDNIDEIKGITEEGPFIESTNLKVSLLSDIHYFSPSMIKDCNDYNADKSRDRKLLDESSAILDRALEKVKEEKPDVLLISGDITKDGELQGHKEVASRLKKLKDELKSLGTDIKIYLINGNHDINNSNAKDFSTGKAVNTAKTTAEDFRRIYKEFTTEEAIETFKPKTGQAGSLSYVVSPKKGYTIIAVDSCKYSSDITSKGENEHETSGAISEELKNWIIDNAKKAKEKGDTVILLQHHGIVPHFDTQAEILKPYLIDKFDIYNKEFADAGIGYAFTGHMHANDISKLVTDKNNTLYDIETGSAVTYPCPTRVVEFSKENNNDKVKETVKINTKLIDKINYKDISTGKKINDLKSYSYKNSIGSAFFTENAKRFAWKVLDEINTEGGMEKYLTKKLNKEVGEYVIDALSKSLPKSESTAKDLDGKVKIYYDLSKDRIVIMGKSFYKQGRLYITSDAIKKEVVSKVLAQIDKKILRDKNYVNTVIDHAVLNALNTNVYSKGTTKKSALDLYNSVYYRNLAGEEKPEAWVSQCAEDFKSGKNLDKIINTVSKDISQVIIEKASTLTFDTDNIITRGSGLTSTVMRGIVIIVLGDNLEDIIKIGKIDVNDKVTDIIYSILKDGKKEEIANLAYNVILSMSNDSNYPEDNNTVIEKIN